jgi:c-di-GMP-binding flagellar brake protein YcgR
MKDLSRGGSSLVVNAELPVGSQVEARFTLKTKTDPVVQVCQVVRASKIQTSDKNVFGIRFVDIDSAEAEKLDTFVHERQAQRRNRGIV